MLDMLNEEFTLKTVPSSQGAKNIVVCKKF